jgi:hypothetical protein
MIQAKQQLERCLDKFRAGTLTEQDLEQALESVNSQTQAQTKPQRLLYLQATNTSVTSTVEGMSIVEGDGIHNGPDNPDDWPYQTVHEAMLDGWHIVKFPEMTLMLVGENETYGLGCEFILEK